MMDTKKNMEMLSIEKQALLALGLADQKIKNLEYQCNEPIAIVGMNCKLPGGVDSKEDFWELLVQKKDAITSFDTARWNETCFNEDPNNPGTTYSKYGGFLKDIYGFDTKFFGISADEAQNMDPQQRVVLETTWHALEDAGIVPTYLRTTSVGVFVGIGAADYTFKTLGKANLDQVNPYTALGLGASFAAGRIAYFLGTQGPTFSVDTACSSSLVSVHQACASLRTKECNLALAGGVHIMTTPEVSIALSKTGALSPIGRCHTFSDQADGYVRGEGCGMLVLKRLSDAQKDGDTILAVIKGSAVNHDGPSSGFTVPNGKAQEALLQTALKNSGITANQVSYIETHGTGTPLGDPIEVEAITSVLGEHRTDDRLVLGAVKTNIGHLESAAGIAGLMKIVMAMQHKKIPANLHFNRPNPLLDMAQLPIQIPTDIIPWNPNGTRIAGVSSFGLSGTNAHIILEEAPASIPVALSKKPDANVIVVLSAKTDASLTVVAQHLKDYIGNHPKITVETISYHLNCHRAHLPSKLAIIAKEKEELLAALTAFLANATRPNMQYARVIAAQPLRTAFVFPGQGSQYVSVGSELYATIPYIAQTIQSCLKHIPSEQAIVVQDILEGKTPELIHSQAYSGPFLFLIEYAVAKYWMHLGIQPTVVSGYSLGEYVAATLAGVLTVQDALALVTESSRLVAQLSDTGAMVVVYESQEKIEALIQENKWTLTIAAIHYQDHITIAGDTKAVEQFLAYSTTHGIRYTVLDHVPAYHSAVIETIVTDYIEFAKGITYHDPKVDMISGCTGHKISSGGIDASYWAGVLRNTVRYDKVVKTLAEYPIDVSIEMGPNTFLSAILQQSEAHEELLLLASLRPKASEQYTLYQGVVQLYLKGVPIVWKHLYAEQYPKIALPLYPFYKTKKYTVVSEKEVLSSKTQRKNRPQEIPDSKAIQEVLAAIIIDQIIDVTEHTIESITPFREEPIQNLGLDSLLLMNIRAQIIKKFPALKDVSLLVFKEGASINSIISTLSTADRVEGTKDPKHDADVLEEQSKVVFEDWERSFKVGHIKRIAKALVHKHNESNVLVSQIACIAKDVFIAEITQDTTHAFFYEHAKDHVPGMYILEAVSQAGRAVPHLFYDTPMTTAYVMNQMEADFQQFAEVDRPLFMTMLVTDALYAKGILQRMKIDITIQQSGTIIGTITGVGQLISGAVYAEKRKESLAVLTPSRH